MHHTCLTTLFNSNDSHNPQANRFEYAATQSTSKPTSQASPKEEIHINYAKFL